MFCHADQQDSLMYRWEILNCAFFNAIFKCRQIKVVCLINIYTTSKCTNIEMLRFFVRKLLNSFHWNTDFPQVFSVLSQLHKGLDLEVWRYDAAMTEFKTMLKNFFFRQLFGPVESLQQGYDVLEVHIHGLPLWRMEIPCSCTWKVWRGNMGIRLYF